MVQNVWFYYVHVYIVAPPTAVSSPNQRPAGIYTLFSDGVIVDGDPSLADCECHSATIQGGVGLHEVLEFRNLKGGGGVRLKFHLFT